MYKGYSWSCSDVLSLLSVSFNPDKEEQTISCPFCGSKRFGMNIKKGTGHCFKCGATADSTSYYAATTGQSLNDARDDIKHRLNIPDEYGKLPERKVYKERKQESLAPIDVRDKTYRAFLDELILSQKNYDNLKARGFSDDDIVAKGYKTFPSVENTLFEDLCRRLLNKGCTLSGVPGFYQNDKGEWTFVRITPGIIIPQIGIHASLIAVQGVHALNPLKEALLSLKPYGLKTVNVAFDMDYLTNKNVKDAMEKVTALIKELGYNYENLMNWEYKQKDENGNEFFLKGLDDYLAFQQRGIKPVIIKH